MPRTSISIFKKVGVSGVCTAYSQSPHALNQEVVVLEHVLCCSIKGPVRITDRERQSAISAAYSFSVQFSIQTVMWGRTNSITKAGIQTVLRGE